MRHQRRVRPKGWLASNLGGRICAQPVHQVRQSAPGVAIANLDTLKLPGSAGALFRTNGGSAWNVIEDPAVDSAGLVFCRVCGECYPGAGQQCPEIFTFRLPNFQESGILFGAIRLGARKRQHIA
jgi:hypothetical protein